MVAKPPGSKGLVANFIVLDGHAVLLQPTRNEAPNSSTSESGGET